MVKYENIIKAMDNELNKTYSHKPHLQDLPYDLRVQDPELLQERIDAIDKKIAESETKIKEIEEGINYDKKIYEQAQIDQLLNNCREYIDGKYSKKALLEAIGEDKMFGERQYNILIDSIKSIHPDFQADGKNNPLTIENLSDWYNNRGFGQRHSELKWVSGMLTQYDGENQGTSGPAGVDLVPWTKFLRQEAERTGNPLLIEARNHSHQTSRIAEQSSTVLWGATTEYKDKGYTMKELESEKTKLKDYENEKIRAEQKKEEVE